MKLTDLTLNNYLDLLSSAEPAPGGGSASALLGAQGAGLAAMVCALTIGKSKYAQHEALCRDVMEKALALKGRLADLIDRDTQAYNQVTEALLLPRETDQQKEARKLALQAALKASAMPPCDIMESAVEALKLVHSLMGRSNQSAASDLGVSALNLKGALQGAWLNVLINLSGITDQAFTDDFRARGEAMLAEGLPLADDIYQRTVALL